MASAAKQVCRQARQFSSHRTQWLSIRQTSQTSSGNTTQTPLRRAFSSTTPQRAENSTSEASPDNDNAPYFNQTFFRQLDRDDQAAYRGYSESERRQMERVNDALRDEFSNDSRTHRELEEQIRNALLDVDERFPEKIPEREPKNDGFFQMGEKDNIGPDDEFNGDDISSHAHGELEQTREIREYARNAAWEMPLLAHLAKPFQPPTNATPLRFRYTSYLGEQHPAAKKVVVEFDPNDLTTLTTPSQILKLIKLLGPRYNPVTKIAKLSAEDHETSAQNKRYLGDTIVALIAEAKDVSADDFADVPVDVRHRKLKPKLQFPERWLLTQERKAELEAKRAAMLEAEAKLAELPEGEGLVDGVSAIEAARKIERLAKLEAPVMAEARAPLAKGKQGKQPDGSEGPLRVAREGDL